MCYFALLLSKWSWQAVNIRRRSICGKFVKRTEAKLELKDIEAEIKYRENIVFSKTIQTCQWLNYVYNYTM